LLRLRVSSRAPGFTVGVGICPGFAGICFASAGICPGFADICFASAGICPCFADICFPSAGICPGFADIHSPREYPPLPTGIYFPLDLLKLLTRKQLHPIVISFAINRNGYSGICVIFTQNIFTVCWRGHPRFHGRFW